MVISTIEQTIGAKVDLAGHIGERRMLLVIDNLEQVIDAAPELARLSEGCPALVLIITSRELLRVSGEAGIAVPPLGSDDAVELFRERSAAPVSPTVAELCDRLDRLPLAVELAAARSRAMSPAAMLDRLGRRLDLLRGGRDIDPRQQTLRATVEWSHDLLHLSEQELFRGLGVFAGSATLEAIETILEADLEDLQSLVDKSLVGYADDRYRMLETIREFAAERLDASPDAEVIRHRHAAWIQDFVDRADAALEGSGQEVWLARSSAEHDDIRAGLAWSIRTGQADPAIAIAGSSATFWWIAGHWSEGRRWLAEALAIPGATDHRRKAKALEGLANLDVRLGDFGAAQVEASESLRISQTRGDLRGIARATRVLCIAAWGAGRAEEAREYARQSEATARAAGDPWALSMALNNLGYEALEVGAYAEALALLDEAVALARERGDRRSEAFFVENVAMARFNLDGARAARHDFARSLDIADSLGFLEVVATDLIGAAAVADQDGDPSRAAMLLGGAERIVQQTGGGLDTAEARMRDATLEAIRRRLGPELERVFELGRSTEPAEVVAIALATLETDRGSEGG